MELYESLWLPAPPILGQTTNRGIIALDSQETHPDLPILLVDVCIEDVNSSVEQDQLVEILEIGDDMGAKSRLSRAVSFIFPNSSKKRVLKGSKQMYPLQQQ